MVKVKSQFPVISIDFVVFIFFNLEILAMVYLLLAFVGILTFCCHVGLTLHAE
jgi:hypothetical protein